MVDGGVVGRSVNEGGGWKLRFEMHKGNGKMPSSPKTPIQTTLAKYRIKLTSHHIFDKLVIP
jgi:hypothetical protein